MKNLNNFLLLVVSSTLILLNSCDKGGDLPAIPENVIRDSDDLTPAPDSDQDNQNPDNPDNSGDTNDPTDPDTPTQPTDPRPQSAIQRILPSDVNPDDVILVYRKSIDPMQLGQVTDSRKCHPVFPHKCIWNSQVIFGYDTTILNQDYPKELWEITSVEITTSLYTLAIDKRDEFFCIHNLKLCSGELNKDDDNQKFIVKNPKFWNGDNDDHMTNNIFTNVLRAHQIEDELWIVRDHSFDIAKLYNLSTLNLRTLFRKNNFISFSISDDTYVEDPIIKVYLNRRLPAL